MKSSAGRLDEISQWVFSGWKSPVAKGGEIEKGLFARGQNMRGVLSERPCY